MREEEALLQALLQQLEEAMLQQLRGGAVAEACSSCPSVRMSGETGAVREEAVLVQALLQQLEEAMLQQLRLRLGQL